MWQLLVNRAPTVSQKNQGTHQREDWAVPWGFWEELRDTPVGTAMEGVCTPRSSAVYLDHLV